MAEELSFVVTRPFVKQGTQLIALSDLSQEDRKKYGKLFVAGNRGFLKINQTLIRRKFKEQQKNMSAQLEALRKREFDLQTELASCGKTERPKIQETLERAQAEILALQAQQAQQKRQASRGEEECQEKIIKAGKIVSETFEGDKKRCDNRVGEAAAVANQLYQDRKKLLGLAEQYSKAVGKGEEYKRLVAGFREADLPAWIMKD